MPFRPQRHPAFDAASAQRASRRAGLSAARGFKFAVQTTGKQGRRLSGKLTPEVVREMRRWAGGEGWGLPQSTQAKILQERHPYVAVLTIVDVLRNASWSDPSYVPGAVDPAYWQTATVPTLMLKFMSRRRACHTKS